ncbi:MULTISPECIES: ribosome maturation factor RimM [Enterococcus]|uniref:Ribosome maturation factor RimM n=1 Tax=Enterococcus malodoratus ATCC 43197 TaxID=1158601 RepID=R2R7B4_9ENTE|nr:MULTISPECIES: ribosome maturation factor RimM [Enterococcus]BBM17654.1 ribosome maturation factor RimM [Enterococcus avium]EOH79470.1 16S rRNA processing protein RimM [Enterococcus malodoratus ATCC 43197]EOT64771.1 16S rRNA processing protein RimM [Enterococcus malodoratus ATCC 43197]OJG65430.1 16S rRNA processing protein RimM [Enterococcus malodoratus]SES67499.1 16S rRNA processing protein RimM [Enterococcus malodoratus]
MTNYYKVGKIVNTHGIRGEVRVISSTDFTEERYRVGEQLFLFRENQETLPLTIASYRRHKNFDLLSFEGYPNINQVEPFRDGILKISEKQMGELDEHEYYYHEIIGLTVVDEDDKEIGKITEILSPGANDVWVVKRKGQKDALIPYIESVVKDIDLTEGIVHVEIPEGLLDDAN